MGKDYTGSFLEKRINLTNIAYEQRGWALINKVPTPWKVFYDPKRRINKAVPEQKSTVDYIGVWEGRPIAFDAKSTKNKTSFPLANVERHQVDFLKKHKDQDGIQFLIVEFSMKDEVYLLPFELLYEYWENSFKGGRKSIPYNVFASNCNRIRSGRGLILDYLQALD